MLRVGLAAVVGLLAAICVTDPARAAEQDYTLTGVASCYSLNPVTPVITWTLQSNVDIDSYLREATASAGRFYMPEQITVPPYGTVVGTSEIDGVPYGGTVSLLISIGRVDGQTIGYTEAAVDVRQVCNFQFQATSTITQTCAQTMMVDVTSSASNPVVARFRIRHGGPDTFIDVAPGQTSRVTYPDVAWTRVTVLGMDITPSDWVTERCPGQGPIAPPGTIFPPSNGTGTGSGGGTGGGATTTSADPATSASAEAASPSTAIASPVGATSPPTGHTAAAGTREPASNSGPIELALVGGASMAVTAMATLAALWWRRRRGGRSSTEPDGMPTPDPGDA